MSAMSVQPLFVRVTHWVNTGAFLVMAASGLQIYNAYPIAPFRFPAWMTLGDWLGGALLWHFAAMWVFGFNLLAMLIYGLISGRYRQRLFPLSLGAALRESVAALRGQVHHDPNRYNAVQRLLYAGVLAALTVLVLSGLSIWKPVQFQELTWLFGGFQGARLVHFLAMAGVSAFVILHVVMALLVPRTLRAMTIGR